MMPRPGVRCRLDIALIDSDRQAIANGITTVFHGVTWSWEPGLRGADNARGILAGIEALQPRLAADTRFHLRHETFNLEAETEMRDWLAARRIRRARLQRSSAVAEAAKRPDKIAQMVQRSGLPHDDFLALVERLRRAATKCRTRSRGSPKPPPQRHSAAVPRRCQPGAAPMVPRPRLPGQRISDEHRDRARAAAAGDNIVHRRAERDARQEPHGLGQRDRHGRARPLLGAGVGLLLSGATDRGVPLGRHRRRAARKGVAARVRDRRRGRSASTTAAASSAAGAPTSILVDPSDAGPPARRRRHGGGPDGASHRGRTASSTEHGILRASRALRERCDMTVLRRLGDARGHLPLSPANQELSTVRGG